MFKLYTHTRHRIKKMELPPFCSPGSISFSNLCKPQLNTNSVRNAESNRSCTDSHWRSICLLLRTFPGMKFVYAFPN